MSTVFLGQLACLLIGLAAGFICGVFFGAAVYQAASTRADTRAAGELAEITKSMRETERHVRDMTREFADGWEPVDDDEGGEDEKWRH